MQPPRPHEARRPHPAHVRARARPAPIATRAHAHRWIHEVAFWTLASGIPAAVGAGVARLSRSRGLGLAAGAGLLGLAGVVRWQLLRWFTSEPAYEVERRVGPLELRRYAPRVEARIRIPTDDFDVSLDEGFRRLAHYLFGHNHEREAVATTARITSAGERLAMTIPVTSSHERGVYTIAFVMPPGRTIESLPVPDDARISLVRVPSQRVAAQRYKGRYNHERVDAAKSELVVHVARADLVPLGEPVFAAFDPPSTHPRLRRCEVWIEIAPEPHTPS